MDDQWVLQVVEHGYRLEFDGPPLYSGIRHTRLHGDGASVLLEEVEGLLQKSAVELVPPGQEGDSFYSTFFTVPKKDGGIRPILNLKPFNVCLAKHRFKMETLQSILSAAQPGTWLASVDLKDAYFHVPIWQPHRKFLRFVIQDRHLQYKVTPFGLSPAPMLWSLSLGYVCWGSVFTRTWTMSSSSATHPARPTELSC